MLETGDSLLLENYYYWEALAIVVGNYTYTGFGVNFIKGRIMKVIVGLYSLSGSGLLFNRLIIMSLGEYALTYYPSISE